MQTKSHRLFRKAGALSATTLAALTTTQLSAADNSDAFPAFDSYIKISGQTASINGNGAEFQKRYGQNENYGAGIEDFYYGRDLTKSTAMTIQGHAMGGSEDYLLHINVTKSELGSIDVGYESFRTFYNGVGGFFPGGAQWQPVSSIFPKIPQDMSLDRGKFWAEAKFGKENLPEMSLRYTNETRAGFKDSTVWGESNNTGINYTNTPPGVTGVITNAAQRKDLPSYLDISERHQSLVGTVKHTIGKTTAQLSLLGDWSTINNGRYTMKYPGEAQPVKVVAGPNNDTLITPTGSPAVLASNWATFGTQTEQNTFDAQDTHTYGITGTTVTELTDRLTLRTGAGYQNVTNDFGGERLTIARTPNGPDYGLTTVTNYFDFDNLVGKSKVDALTGNAGVEFAVTKDLTASLSVRGEDRNANSDASYDKKSKPRSGSPVVPVTSLKEASAADEQSLTPVADLRYTGVKDLALYSTASRKFGTGSEIITAPYNPTGAPSSGEQVYFNDITEDKAEYLVGANWRACSFLTLRGEPFVKDNVYHVKGFNRNVKPASVLGNATDNNYELESQFFGVKLTAIAKPIQVLTFTTRYIYQRGDGQVTGYLPTTPQYDSMESTTHTIAETIDWNPTEQFYMQASANVVFNVISTAYQHDQSTAAANAIPGNLVLQNSDNNYTTFSLLAGLAVTKSDDVQVQFTAYRADNYNSDLALYTQPYGASATESTITLGLKHKFSSRLIGNAKVGYTDSRNDTNGGYTDYHGVLGYLSLAYEL
jgi:hypothetical protein